MINRRLLVYNGLIAAIFTVASCNTHDANDYYDQDKYILLTSEVEETGSRRETYGFENNRRYTFVKVYWPEGKIMRESFMKDNLLHGLSKTYTPEGKLDLSIQFKDDLKDGKFIAYDEKGKVKNCEIYKKGKLTGEACK